jgi:phosphatidate cytidylyltransferase
MSELSRRVATAALLLPVAVAAVLLLPTPHFAAVIGAVIAGAAWEWSALAGLTRTGPRALYVAALVGCLVGLYLLAEAWRPAVLALGLAWWGVAAALVVRFEVSAAPPPRAGGFGPLAGLLVLAPAWLALVAAHGHSQGGPYWVLLLLALVWAADVGAYFAGRRWGRRRLARRVSPGKSWEGVGGGTAAALGLALAAGLVAGLPAPKVLAVLALALGTVLVSVLGDLTESLFKRAAGVKDSGSWLPGHGGVLDRIDSVTAAAPLYALGLGWIGVAL